MEDKLPPSYCMLDLVNTGQAVHYVFMYNGSRFYVTVTEEKLRGKGRLVEEFSRFTQDLDDLDAMFRFEDWVLEALGDFMSKVAPLPAAETRKRPVTLLDFYSKPTYALELVNDGSGRLRPVETVYDPRRHGDTSPRTLIVRDDGEKVRDRDRDKGGCILGSLLPAGVPRILASELERMDEDAKPRENKGGDDAEFKEVEVELEELGDAAPTKVRRIGTEQVFFFRPVVKHRVAELERLSRISLNSDKFVPPFRTSRLAGLVVWDDDRESSLLGFLLDHVEGRTLAACMGDSTPGLRMKWISEIEVTLRRLHECGIVWGVVSADNVMINADGDAVIMALGADDDADDEEQTMGGDMLGLEQMRTELVTDETLYTAASH